MRAAGAPQSGRITRGFSAALAAVTLASSLLAACGPSQLAPHDAPAARSHREIVGGTPVPEGQELAVVALVRPSSISANEWRGWCSATVIAPTTVLTAAHCVDFWTADTTYYVGAGSLWAFPTDSRKVTEVVIHPGWGGADARVRADLALLRIESAFSNVVPIPANGTGHSFMHVGLTMRNVGFGRTASGSSGTKYEVSYPLLGFWQDDLLESGGDGKQVCFGDSGGPALMVLPENAGEAVVGVASLVESQDCGDGLGWHTRTDLHILWIRQTMAAWEGASCFEDGACKEGCSPMADVDCTCVADGACTAACPDLAKDPDCPLTCSEDRVCSTEACPVHDVDCVPVGGACSDPGQCAGRRCLRDPQHPTSYCSRACQRDLDCELGEMVCADGACRWAQRPEAKLFGPCDDAMFCPSGAVCDGATAEDRRCYFRCEATADCPLADDQCVAGVSGRRFCLPDLSPPPPPPPPPEPAPPPADVTTSCSASGGSVAWALGLLAFARGKACRRTRGWLTAKPGAH